MNDENQKRAVFLLFSSYHADQEPRHSRYGGVSKDVLLFGGKPVKAQERPPWVELLRSGFGQNFILRLVVGEAQASFS